jgi:hypothetical protein
MASNFNCPSCGAPLHTDGSEVNIHCEYCGASVIVPPELRTHQASPDGAFSAGGDPAFQRRIQLRQMMQLIREGRLDEAAQLFSSATGTPLESARHTVGVISNALMGGRIDPDALSGILGRVGQDAASWETYQTVVQPTRADLRAEARAARRANRRGCLLPLVFLAFLIFIGYVTFRPLSFARQLSSFFSSGRTVNIEKTVQGPAEQIQTQVAPILKTAGVQDVLGGAEQPVLTFGGEGIGPGLLKDARSIAIDGEGRIYTADYTGGRVQVFSREGKYLSGFLVDTKMPLTSMDVDRSGKVYIIQSGKITVYNGETGKAIQTIKATDFASFDSLFITPTGQIAAAQTGAKERLVILDADGSIQQTIDQPFTNNTGDSELDMHVTVDGQGTIYLAGSFNSAVLKFSPEGKYLNRFGSSGNEAGQFQAIETIAVDGQGQVYVSDIHGIQVFSADGRYLKTIKIPSGVPFGMTFASNGNLLVTNRTNVYELAIK